MYEINKYIENIKNKVDYSNETKLIMKVYIDLGKRLRFDEDFFFGGSKMKKRLYFTPPSLDFLDESFKKGKVTCKSSSYLLNYILKQLGIDIKVVVDNKDFRRYKHVYNVVKEKCGKVYTIDLQDDIMNIRNGSRTWSFGISKDGNSYVIDLNTQMMIHKSLGYIDYGYTDDYIYVLKNYLSCYSDIYSKIDFVLENIDINKQDISYFERRWNHERILRCLFSDKDLMTTIHTLELYRNGKDSKEFVNAFYVSKKNNIDIYVYDEYNYKYIKYSLEEYINYAGSNSIESRNNIPGYRTMKNKMLIKK